MAHWDPSGHGCEGPDPYQVVSNFQYLWRIGEDLAEDGETLDNGASDFVEELGANGDHRGYASDLLSSLQHHLPKLRDWLVEGWCLLRAWQMNELPDRGPTLLLKTGTGGGRHCTQLPPRCCGLASWV